MNTIRLIIRTLVRMMLSGKVVFCMKFDYSKEPRRDILCIDVKSFYSSVECVERGLDPLKTMLIVMSGADNAGGLVLAASPMAKKF